jgi:hypothetical protein
MCVCVWVGGWVVADQATPFTLLLLLLLLLLLVLLFTPLPLLLLLLLCSAVLLVDTSRPDWPVLYANRGWSRLVADALGSSSTCAAATTTTTAAAAAADSSMHHEGYFATTTTTAKGHQTKDSDGGASLMHTGSVTDSVTNTVGLTPTGLSKVAGLTLWSLLDPSLSQVLQLQPVTAPVSLRSSAEDLTTTLTTVAGATTASGGATDSGSGYGSSSSTHQTSLSSAGLSAAEQMLLQARQQQWLLPCC